MRIIEQSPARLVVAHPPLWLGAATAGGAAVCGWVALGLARAGDAAGAAMIGAGAVLCAAGAWVLARPVRTTFDRAAGTVTVRPLGGAARVVALTQVAGAAAAPGRATMTPGDRPGQRAALVLRDGTRVPLAPAHVTGRSAGRAAAAIAAWLAAP